MKSKSILAGFIAALMVVLTLGRPALAQDDSSLSSNGFTVSWDSTKLIMPSDCSRYSFNYVSNVGFELLSAEIEITDADGTSISRESNVGVPNGSSGTWSSQICSFEVSTLGPYTITLKLEDYNSNTASQQTTFYFKPKSTAVKGVSVVAAKTTCKLVWIKDWLNVDNYQVRLSNAGSTTKFQKWFTGPSSWGYFTYTNLRRHTKYVIQIRSVKDGRYGTITSKSFTTK